MAIPIEPPVSQSPRHWEQIDLLGLIGGGNDEAAAPSRPAAPPTRTPETRTPQTRTPETRTPETRAPSAACQGPAAGPTATAVAAAATVAATVPAASAPVPSPAAATAESVLGAPGPTPPPCPERLLILDTETTGLSPAAGQCIEVGGVLFHVPSRAVLTQVSFLLPCATNPALHVNGIAAEVSRLEQPWPIALRCFLAMVESADALLAHNAGFDRQWFGQGALPELPLPWICSMEDIRWPAERGLRPTPSVKDLALAYGVPVWAAHRALTDCTYLVQVLERCDDLEELLRAALEPRRLYRARLSYAERHRAKAAGFRWNDPLPGAWSRRLSQRERDALDFPVEVVEPVEAG